MSRRQRGREICGWVLLDKPKGISSNQALQRVRRALDARKAGHGGSLDPMAEGLLPILLGDATRLSQFALDGDKSYRFALRLGWSTTSGDADGEALEYCDQPLPDALAVEQVLPRFLGAQQQIPPMHSALKRDGQPLYKLAHQGLSVEREPRQIQVHSLSLQGIEGDQLWLEATVSKGTYIRTLGEDIAKALGQRGHLSVLRRTAAAGFAEPGLSLDALEATPSDQRLGLVRGVGEWLPTWPRLQLDGLAIADFQHGRASAPVESAALEAGCSCLVEDRSGRVLGLGEWDGSKLLPQRVFSAQAWQPGSAMEITAKA